LLVYLFWEISEGTKDNGRFLKGDPKINGRFLKGDPVNDGRFLKGDPFVRSFTCFGRLVRAPKIMGGSLRGTQN